MARNVEHLLNGLRWVIVDILGLILSRVKYTLQPSTCTKVRFSTFNSETGQETPSNYQNWTNLVLGRFQKRFSIFRRRRNFKLFFEHLNVLKWKNSKLQSCRFHWGLQFTYKNYLHPTSYWRVFYFLKFESHPRQNMVLKLYIIFSSILLC